MRNEKNENNLEKKKTRNDDDEKREGGEKGEEGEGKGELPRDYFFLPQIISSILVSDI